MLDTMIDLETWGKKPGCQLRSIGAVAFDPFDWSKPFIPFYRNVNDTVGARDASTVKWWSEQSWDAHAAFSSPAPVDLKSACTDLVAFYRQHGGGRIWCHGATFDVPIFEWSLMASCWMEPPWEFHMVRDTRTAYDMAGTKSRPIAPYLVKHNALHDAANQATAVQLAYSMLTVNVPTGIIPKFLRG